MDEPAWVKRALVALDLRRQAVDKREEAERWPRWHRKRRSLLREAESLDAAFDEAAKETAALRAAEEDEP